ncbi:MAG: TRAP transporter large permease subunit [Chromatiales bacterium]|jgi:tripartite ATP-independent transporter DctM subunit|nr:TRAP transporter large permease subunit [Chromatiales bacterium]
MELYFLALLVLLMAGALASGYPVAFALPGSAILSILAAAACGYLFEGNPDAYFAQGGPSQWLSAGVTNLRGVYWEVERDTLIAIPLFIFMGIMLQRSKIAEDLLLTMAQLFGPVPGGLGISVVFVGALLAATTGILGATVVAMGLISLPAMLRNNYSKSLASGTIAASGTLGQIIPPSIVLIILADQLASAVDQAGTTRELLYKNATGEISMPSEFGVVSTSAGEMFMGAFIPGLVLVGLYMVYILTRAALQPGSAPAVTRDDAFDKQFLIKVVVTLVPPLSLIFLVLGSIIAGVATVNQAGAIGAAGAMLMAGYRLREGEKGAYYPAIIGLSSLVLIAIVLALFDTNIKSVDSDTDRLGIGLGLIGVTCLVSVLIWSGLRIHRIDNTLYGVMVETAKTTSLVFIILLGAAMLTAAFRAFGGEDLVREFLNGLPGGFWSKFIIVMAVIFVLGFFLDFIEIAVVVVPIVAPILLADPSANITAVWLGVMIGLNIQTSFLTPPFGFALFYLRGVAPAVVRTLDMYKGVVPFIALQLAALGIVGYLPQLVNYLPNRISFTSETAPPPRNPKLQYCLQRYVGEQFAEEGDRIASAIATAQNLDISYLPKKLKKTTENAFESAAGVQALLDGAFAAEETTRAASAAYRPLHHRVRFIENEMRGLTKEIEYLTTEATHQQGDGAATRILAINQQIKILETQREEVAAAIPAEWEGRHKTFAALVKAERTAIRNFQRGSDGAFVPVVTLVDTLNSSAALAELGPEILALGALVAQTKPGDMVDSLTSLIKRVNSVKGAADIKSRLSKARRYLKRKKPKVDKATKELAKALSAYSVQITWRDKANALIAPGLMTYLDEVRTTLGARQQSKMTREQSLYVAACSSNHRDIALNF